MNGDNFWNIKTCPIWTIDETIIMDLKGKLIEFIHTNKIDKDKRSGNKQSV